MFWTKSAHGGKSMVLTLEGWLQILEEQRSAGIGTVKYDIDELILRLIYLKMVETEWTCLPCNKYLN